MSHSSPSYYAAIDLGSNSCRLLIVKECDGVLERLTVFSKIIRLSEGLFKTGRISGEAELRAIEVLSLFRKRIAPYPSLTMRCVATEACRKATNQKAFLERVYKETGFKLSVISEEEEARLVVCGLEGFLDPAFPYALVFDVGGGSSEIVLVKNQGNKTPEIMGWLSIPMGVVSLVETQSPENASNYLSVVASVKEILEAFGEKYGVQSLIDQKQVQLIGTSGTATTVAALHLGLRYYDGERVDGLLMTFEEVLSVIRDLQMMSLDERGRHPCIGPERADLVLAGMAIFQGLAEAWPVGHLYVAERGVRDGIIRDLIEQAKK